MKFINIKEKLKVIIFNGFENFSEFVFSQIICAILLVLGVIMSIIAPSYIGKLIDSVKNNSINEIKINIILLVTLTFCSIFFSYYQNMKYNHFETRLNSRLRNSIIEKLTTIGFDKWSEYNVGYLNTVLDKDCLSFSSFAINEITSTLTYFLTFLGLSIYILRIDSFIGSFSIIGVIVFLVIQKLYTKPFRKLLKKLKNMESEVSLYANEILNNADSYFLIDGVMNSKSAYNKSNNDLFFFLFKLKNKYYFSSIISQGFNMIIIVGILIIWIKYRSHLLSTGQLVNLILYSQRLYGPVFKLTELSIKFKEFGVNLERIYNILRVPSIEYGEYNILNVFRIEIDSISKKVNGKNLYHNLSVEMFKGEIVGIIGENGSGKSMLVRMLRKYVEDYEGEIRFNDININEMSRDSIFNLVSVMPQKVAVTTQEVELAKEYLKKHDVGGYLDIDGLNITDLYSYHESSGGELQKISFIKTIRENKEVIILDEPTSSMDLNGERITAEIIKKIKSNKIIIIITHREYLLSICDKVIELT